MKSSTQNMSVTQAADGDGIITSSILRLDTEGKPVLKGNPLKRQQFFQKCATADKVKLFCSLQLTSRVLSWQLDGNHRHHFLGAPYTASHLAILVSCSQGEAC